MITVTQPDALALEEITTWPVWHKEPCQFDLAYPEKEQFLILAGNATLKGSCGSELHISPGDFVTVHSGIDVNWQIHSNIAKHYKFF